jgi:hypothetical protein
MKILRYMDSNFHFVEFLLIKLINFFPYTALVIKLPNFDGNTRFIGIYF